MLPQVAARLGSPDAAAFEQDDTLMAAQSCADWLAQLAPRWHLARILLEHSATIGRPVTPQEWQEAITEAERRVQRGAPLPAVRPVAISPGRSIVDDELIAFHGALTALAQTQDVFGPLAVSTPASVRRDSSFWTLTSDECVAYLEAFFTVALRNYRGLMERNFSRLAPYLGFFRNDALALHITVGPQSNGPVTSSRRSEFMANNRLYAIDDVGVGIVWRSSQTGIDVIEVALPTPGQEAWDVVGDDGVAIAPEQLSRFYRWEGHMLSSFMGDDALLRFVYGMLDYDMRELFDSTMWPGNQQPL